MKSIFTKVITMNKIIYIFFLFFVVVSCEKVIEIDLNESEPAVVIEGNLSHNDAELDVKISKTASYFSNEPTLKVENAEVYLESSPGFRIKADEIGQGQYILRNLPLNFQAVYRLTVKIGKDEYTGVSTLNQLVEIDSLSYEYQAEQTFFDSGYRILLYFSDPYEEENYYRVKIYKNGKRFDEADDIIVFDDSSINGRNIQVRMRSQLFEVGDTAKVELFSIDRNAWEYLSSLRELVNQNPGSPSPANPLSNLSNGALGYFSAWTKSTSEIVIQ